MFYLDKGMQSLIRQLEPEEEPVKKKPSQTSILNSLEKMSEREKYRELRRLMTESTGESKEARAIFNSWASTLLNEKWRPKFKRAIKKQPARDREMKQFEINSKSLAEVPFSTTERYFVEGLLSLLMRTSESVARRPWPQKKLPSFDHPSAERKDREEVNQVRNIRRKMERDEGRLNELRGRIELGWLDHNSTREAKRLTTPSLIETVRALDQEALGIALLPSMACILRIIDIVNEISPIQKRHPVNERWDMPAELKEEFEKQLRLMKLYDDWRATNPPDSDRFVDFMMKDARRR
jgi:hypothetical protein